MTEEMRDTLLVALYERRDRLAHLDTHGGVNTPARPTLRERIRDVDRAIKYLRGGK